MSGLNVIVSAPDEISILKSLLEMTNGILLKLYNLSGNEGREQGGVRNETAWPTLKAIAQLFEVNVPAVSKYLLQYIFGSAELEKYTIICPNCWTVSIPYALENTEYGDKSSPLETILT